MQALFVFGPDVRGDGGDVEGRVCYGGGEDVVEGGGDEAQGAVGREQAERLDVYVVLLLLLLLLHGRGTGAFGGGGGGVEGDVGLDAADDAADGFWVVIVAGGGGGGGVVVVVGPADEAGEAAGDGVGGAAVEGLGVADGEEEGV